MERRYLVAALAMITAFAATSHGFRALQQLSVMHVRHSGAMAHSMHEPSCASRALAKIRTHLRPRYPEEAQLLAEMNVPLASMQTTIEEQMVRQNSAIAQCARAQAMRDSERARHEVMQAQQRLASIGPMALEVNLPADLDQRINAALDSSMAANTLKLQVLADKLRSSSVRIENLDIPIVDVTTDGGRVTTRVHVHTHAACKSGQVAPAPPQPE
jgi:hypothetical protein